MGDAEDKESFRDGNCTLSRVRKVNTSVVMSCRNGLIVFQECTSHEISNEICVGDLHSVN